MSAFANGSGSSSGGTGLGNAMTSGTGGVDTSANSNPTFLMPDGSIASPSANVSPNATGIGDVQSNTPSTAGLTGVQSGMTMPDYANAMSGSGNYSFNMPSGTGGGNMGGALAAGGKLASALQSQQPLKSAGTGRVTMKPQAFGAPVVALPMASGSAQGNSLLSMLQKYRAGTV